MSEPMSDAGVERAMSIIRELHKDGDCVAPLHDQVIDHLLAEVSRLLEDEADYSRTNGIMSRMLEAVAVALKGEPEPLASHSWHDLAEVAQAFRARLAQFDPEGEMDETPVCSYCGREANNPEHQPCGPGSSNHIGREVHRWRYLAAKRILDGSK